MVTELEQKFYDTFGIEKQSICIYYSKYKERGCEVCITYFQSDKNCNKKRYKYPKITAKKLLEMICIYNSTYTNGYTNYSLLNERNVEKLKEQILKNCLRVRDDIKPQIQQLFKGEKGIVDNNV